MVQKDIGMSVLFWLVDIVSGLLVLNDKSLSVLLQLVNSDLTGLLPE